MPDNYWNESDNYWAEDKPTASTTSPMSPIEGASPWAVGEVPAPGEFARKAAPVVAGMAAGSIPGVGGLVAGPLAASVTDIAVNPKDATTGDRETSFLADLGAGLLPGTLKGAYGVAKKLVPAPLEAKIASTIRWGFEKGVRPTVVGKGNAAQIENYYKGAQSATESIIKNKTNLKFTNDLGEKTVGRLPSNLNEFSQSIDQTKRTIFSEYDSIVKGSGGTVDLDSVVSELQSFRTNPVNKMFGGTGNGRADDLIENLSGKKLSLSEAQDAIALLNGRLKAFYSNPSPDLASSAAIDALAANKLRAALDMAVDGSGYQSLKKQYGALRSIEKEVSNRALVDARKNTKGLIDFADIASAAEAARAIATMNSGPAAAAISLRAMKEYYKHLNNPNRIVNKMFSEADKLIARRYGLITP